MQRMLLAEQVIEYLADYCEKNGDPVSVMIISASKTGNASLHVITDDRFTQAHEEMKKIAEYLQKYFPPK